MKWTIITILIPIIVVFGLVAGVIYSCIVWNLTGIYYGGMVAIVGLVILPLLIRKTLDEGLKRNFEMYRRIIEDPHGYRKVYPEEYPKPLIEYYDTVQAELEKLGFRFEADICYHTIENNASLIGKSFLRLLHNHDYCVWAAIFKMNPPWYTRVFLRIIHCEGFLEGFVSLSAAFSDNTILEYGNPDFNLLTAPVPGITKVNLRKCPIFELVEKFADACRSYSLSAPESVSPFMIPIKTLDQVYEKMCEQELREAMHGQKVPPKLDVLVKEGFSREDAEKYIARFNEMKQE